MNSEQDQTLQPFFAPHGVVVIGVSQNPEKLGYGIAQNLMRSGYSGDIHFVNPKGGMLFGLVIHTAVDDVPGTVDLAVLLIPPTAVPPTLAQCGKRGIRAAIIASGGFREIGPEGAELEAEVLRVARAHDMRLIGPNCIGLIDTHLPLDTTFLPPPPPARGDIAFISHSGAICAAMIDWARGEGFGFSRLVSLGNQVDVTESDVLLPVAADTHTRVVTLYLEGVGNGRAFVQNAAQATRRKPVVALKAGRSSAGKRAASSHTGALAGHEAAFDAAFRRAGILRATTAREMFDWARALAWCPPPRGARIAVLTNAGGLGVMAADALAAHGLTLSSVSQGLQELLREILPPAASLANPIDMLASATPEQYAAALRTLLADEGVDAVLVIIPPPPMFTAGGVARAIIPVIQTGNKPVVVALVGSPLVQEARVHFSAARVPIYEFPEQAAGALAALVEYGQGRAVSTAVPLRPLDLEAAAVSSLLTSHPAGWLDQDLLCEVFDAVGIPLPPRALARSASEAVAHARRMGLPVALKIASPDLPHKSDVGGVLLGVESETAVAEGYEMLLARVRAARPDAALWGVEVQRMVPAGQDVIIGVTCDPQFGPLVMFGSGGVQVEGLRDVAFALAPVTVPDLDHMLSSTWAGQKLRGYRDIAGVDETAVRAIIARLAQLADAVPRLAEIEINPLRVLAEGAFAVDVRARLD